MAFLKHPDSSRIVRAKRGTIQYHRLVSRGYTEVSKPAPGAQVIIAREVRKDRRYPLRRPIQDLGVFLYLAKDLTAREKELIKDTIALLERKEQLEETLKAANSWAPATRVKEIV